MKTTAEVLAHLASGNERQRDAYRVLLQSGLFSILEAYTPYPAGTVPIDIDIPGSDLDILCEASDLNAFEMAVTQHFSGMKHFSCERGTGLGMDIISAYMTCSFQIKDWPLEIYAQSLPVNKQNAYLHMLVEWELLQLWGAEGHDEIRRLKWGGLKTEPAFAAVLGLQGDPYEELLHLAHWSRNELWLWARQRTSFQNTY
ncbi:DUF4269 domain-containing protein [Paenibacillus illinoisensis]|uniref:DUF4269 domain-containing protein n=1 Tax=Paenibacillus illinoisensis TaxID=59845 RepID=UPI001C8D20E9|nr:DUF4269 domain-containing protein [Paenibacillus illinoisensis]MBY0218532.1 DUF4269 domain-containing protein [Paenibacillus illinoisensis]